MRNFRCCLCGNEFSGFGNNPEGAAYKDENGDVVMPTFKSDDRCCDLCDSMYVIPGRLYRLSLARQGRTE